jgi:hypothetical protein
MTRAEIDNAKAKADANVVSDELAQAGPGDYSSVQEMVRQQLRVRILI